MINISIIYKITNPSGKVYIGQTINLKARKWAYSRGGSTQQAKLSRSIQKHGWDSHTFDIIFQGICSADCLNKLERYYIAHYNSMKQGLNCTEGGGGARGRTMSAESLAQMSQRLKGRVFTEEWKRKISEACKGRPAHNKGKQKAPELVELHKKPIIQYSKQGDFIREWSCAMEASKALAISNSCIGRCCTGDLKSYSGHVWRHKS